MSLTYYYVFLRRPGNLLVRQNLTKKLVKLQRLLVEDLNHFQILIIRHNLSNLFKNINDKNNFHATKVDTKKTSRNSWNVLVMIW